MGVNFRDDVANHRQVEGLGHAGDLHPLRDPADPDQIDHHVVYRACLDHMSKRHDAVDQLAAADRRRQCRVDPGETGVIVMRGDVLEPEQSDPGILDAAADVDRLFRAPALVDVAHQLDVRTERLAHRLGALDFLRRGGWGGERELHLGLAKTLLLELPGRLYDFAERQITAQRAARISRDTLARPAEEFP